MIKSYYKIIHFFSSWSFVTCNKLEMVVSVPEKEVKTIWDVNGQESHVQHLPFFWAKKSLVGGPGPPLWKIWKSIGMIRNPILMGKCQKWQRNHQPEKDASFHSFWNDFSSKIAWLKGGSPCFSSAWWLRLLPTANDGGFSLKTQLWGSPDGHGNPHLSLLHVLFYLQCGAPVMWTWT